MFNFLCDGIQSGTSNFIDTAINFRYQKSERTIAAALRYLTRELSVSREELFISTKGGIIHEDGDLGVVAETILDELFENGSISSADIFNNNCIHPKFLEMQLEASLKNLGLETIDCYSLNLPEMHLYKDSVEAFNSKLLAT